MTDASSSPRSQPLPIAEILAHDDCLPPAIIGAQELDNGDIEIKPVYGPLTGSMIIPAKQAYYPQAPAIAADAATELWPEAPAGTIIHFLFGPGAVGHSTLPSSLLQVGFGRYTGMEDGKPWILVRPNHMKNDMLLVHIGPRMLTIDCIEDRGYDILPRRQKIPVILPLKVNSSFEIPSGRMSKIAAGMAEANSAGRRAIWRRLYRELRYVINPTLDEKIAFPEAIKGAGAFHVPGMAPDVFEQAVHDALSLFTPPDGIGRALTFSTPREEHVWGVRPGQVADIIIRQDASSEIDTDARTILQAILAEARPYGAGPAGDPGNPLALAANWFDGGIFKHYTVEERDLNGHEQMLATQRLQDMIPGFSIPEDLKEAALKAIGATA